MDLQDAVALSTSPGIARPRAAAVFKALREQACEDASLEDAIAVCVPDGDVGAIASEARRAAGALLAVAAAAGIRTIPLEDAAYPPLLRAIPDPPPVLWTRGCDLPLVSAAVAIVGSRAATPYALEVATRLGGELAG